MAPIGIAIAGSGLFVKESHIPAIEANSDLVELKAIYSRSQKSAQALLSELPSSFNTSSITLYSDDSPHDGEDYTALLARPDISAVIIALPIPTQPTFIKRTLEAHKHVLSEKPIAPTLATAQALLSWYNSQHNSNSPATWSVAENYRFLSRFHAGAAKVLSLGPVTGFRVRMHTLVKPGSKYYETAWRKIPDYQGGFLLDGGVHFIAAMRLLLGREARMRRVSAFTAMTREWLPPIDTVDATVKLANGATGTFSVSFGSADGGVDYVVSCENGSVEVGFDETTSKKIGEEPQSESFPEDKNGVKQEIKGWAEALASGKQNVLQCPEEALADLEVLEAMIRSGETDGAPMDLKMQT